MAMVALTGFSPRAGIQLIVTTSNAKTLAAFAADVAEVRKGFSPRAGIQLIVTWNRKSNPDYRVRRVSVPERGFN